MRCVRVSAIDVLEFGWRGYSAAGCDGVEDEEGLVCTTCMLEQVRLCMVLKSLSRGCWAARICKSGRQCTVAVVLYQPR